MWIVLLLVLVLTAMAALIAWMAKTNPTSAEILFDAAENALGPVSVLVNNAAYSTQGGIDAVSAEVLDAHYAINVRATTLLCAEFARRWRGEASGHIVNLTSGQGLTPMPNEIAYATTKGAIDALTLSLSAALMPRGITVNAVDPGATDTGWISAELDAELRAMSPRGRVGQPEDVARLVGFLVSAEGEWITGQVLRSRGGL